jgi:hypothetical protein
MNRFILLLRASQEAPGTRMNRVSSIHIWNKNFTRLSFDIRHSANERSEAKIVEIDVQP